MRNPPLLSERARPPRNWRARSLLRKKCVWCSRYEPGTPSENTANTPLGGGVSPRTGSSRGEGDRRGGGYRRGLGGALAAPPPERGGSVGLWRRTPPPRG